MAMLMESNQGRRDVYRRRARTDQAIWQRRGARRNAEAGDGGDRGNVTSRLFRDTSACSRWHHNHLSGDIGADTRSVNVETYGLVPTARRPIKHGDYSTSLQDTGRGSAWGLLLRNERAPGLPTKIGLLDGTVLQHRRWLTLGGMRDGEQDMHSSAEGVAGMGGYHDALAAPSLGVANMGTTTNTASLRVST